MKDLKECESIKTLTPFQKRQKNFILDEYPMLDEMMADTIVRLSETQKDAIVEDMKEGKLKHENPMKPEDYVLKSVSIE